MRRIRWLAAAAVTGALVVASSTPPAAGAEAAEEDAVDIAVASYAADYSVSHQEAQRRLDRIQPLQGILASIRELESARLAGWGIDHSRNFIGWVSLTGNGPPPAAATRIGDTHTHVQIRTGAVHSLADLLAAQTGLFQDVGPAGQITDDPETLVEVMRIVAFTDIDMRANAMVIGVDPGLASAVPGELTDPGPVAVTDEVLQTKITEATQLIQPYIDVEYRVEDGRGVASEASFSGGQAMSLSIGSAKDICTAGFAARENRSGVYGIITAGHCGSRGPSEKWTFEMHGVELPHESGWFSRRADAQFHSIPTGSGHVLNDDYLCHYPWPINYCDVTGYRVRSEMVDEYVCHAGRGSGVSCGTVTAINFRPNGCKSASNTAVRCANVFVTVQGPTLHSCDDDSGGPWYRTGTAFGIHWGSNSGDDCTRTGISAYFSAIDEVHSFLGVRVLTSGSVTIN
ncbi:MAG: S1 family peptidase [Acidimicrobiaceae bacterium]|nr:S1 family peptidase [Acidimicrobiaceae bacterium]